MNKIRIAIVDDHDLFRDGIRLVLNQINDFEVVYDTSSGHRFLEMLRTSDVDIVLMDIEMPEISGLETTKAALLIKPGTRIIALTMYSDTGHYTQMIQAGVKGFLLKKANKFELEQAILTVFQGGNYFSQDILQKLAFQFTDRSNEPDRLTHRELEILVLICQGRTTQEISAQLHISFKTVETHRANIFLKAGVRNVAGLISWAIRNQHYTIR